MSDATLQALANKLITKRGRTITFIEFNEVLADSSKPWEGPVDPRVSPTRVLVTFGCFVEPDSLQRLGVSVNLQEFIQRGRRILLTDGLNNLTGYNEVIDQGRNYKIDHIETLQPGPTRLLNFVIVQE